MLSIDSLRKSFGPRTLWENVNLSVPEGSMIALTGPSGSGKSTLLNCLGLLEDPSSGTMTFDGLELTSLRDRGKRRFRRDILGYLFQNYALIENATIEANLRVATSVRGIRGRQAATAMEQALDHVGLAGRLRDKVSIMSGGEQQRVALARLYVKEPRLVLADEPTGALDSGNAEMVVSTLRAMAGNGASVVIATHDDWVREQCDEVIKVEGFAPAVPANA